MHIPVLLTETIAGLQPQKSQNFIDGTFGGGGHTAVILQKTAPDGLVFAFDKDASAIKRAQSFGERVVPIHNSFAEMDNIEYGLRNQNIMGILLDLGFSSWQIDEAARGFSFQADGPLDMRMNNDSDLTAAAIINGWKEDELGRLFKEYGEEKHARRLAKKIVVARKDKPFNTTVALAQFVEKILGRGKKGLNPATKIFQALRIAVNNELTDLERGLQAALALLAPGGRLAVISFHSLEDRMVKHQFKEVSKRCKCPPELWRCVCDKQPEYIVITKKPIIPTKDEITNNPRSRSAKLRIIQKV